MAGRHPPCLRILPQICGSINGMDDEPLTFERLLADMDRLGLARSAPRVGALGFSPRVFLSDHLPAEQPRKLTRWECFRVWIENLADRAEVYYHYTRVKRTEPASAYLIGNDLYVPRRSVAVVRFVT